MSSSEQSIYVTAFRQIIKTCFYIQNINVAAYFTIKIQIISEATMKCKIRGCSSSTLLNVVVKTTFHTIPSVNKDPHRHAIWKRFIDLEVRNGITEKCFTTRKKFGKMISDV